MVAYMFGHLGFEIKYSLIIHNFCEIVQLSTLKTFQKQFVNKPIHVRLRGRSSNNNNRRFNNRYPSTHFYLTDNKRDHHAPKNSCTQGYEYTQTFFSKTKRYLLKLRSRLFQENEEEIRNIWRQNPVVLKIVWPWNVNRWKDSLISLKFRGISK